MDPDLITDGEARAEARRRWGVHGGWALFGNVLDDGTIGPDAHRVGARTHVSGERYSRRVTFGTGDDWDAAFAAADKWLELQRPPRHRASAQERAERLGGLPMAGDLFQSPPKKRVKR